MRVNIHRSFIGFINLSSSDNFETIFELPEHVNNVCKSAHFALRNIGKISKYIDQHDCERLVHAFITSKLDSCNSILFGLPTTEIDKLQRVQNGAARLIVTAKKNVYITPVLKRLHWLPVIGPESTLRFY